MTSTITLQNFCSRAKWHTEVYLFIYLLRASLPCFCPLFCNLVNILAVPLCRIQSVAFPDIPVVSERSSRVISASRRSSSFFCSLPPHTYKTYAHTHKHAYTHQTYTNMAMPRPGAMQSSQRWSLYLLILWVAGTDSSTLRLHPGQRDHTLPQNLGFFTIEANDGTGAGDGGGGAAEAPALPLAARSVAESGSQPGLEPHDRIRRSSGNSAMPKVYGQVNKVHLCKNKIK